MDGNENDDTQSAGGGETNCCRAIISNGIPSMTLTNFAEPTYQAYNRARRVGKISFCPVDVAGKEFCLSQF